jgi:hypothetical protein
VTAFAWILDSAEGMDQAKLRQRRLRSKVSQELGQRRLRLGPLIPSLLLPQQRIARAPERIVVRVGAAIGNTREMTVKGGAGHACLFADHRHCDLPQPSFLAQLGKGLARAPPLVVDDELARK